MPKPTLTVAILQNEARQFAKLESTHPEPTIFGVTDGKAIGTYLEHKFHAHLERKYVHAPGSSASGIDFPGLAVDLKVTSVKQPQSSCPFKSARQKIYGLGYSLLVFVYDKSDNPKTRTATLNILHTIFIEAHRTADFQMTRGLLNILRGRIAPRGAARAQVPRSAARRVPVSGWTAQSPAAGGRQRGV